MLATCEPPSERELKVLDTAADAIALDEEPISNWLTIGAQKTLGNGLIRSGPKGSVPICTPDTVMNRVGASLKAPKGLGAGQLVEYQLQLASKIPMPDEIVIEQVGKAAFNESKQHSEVFPRQDIRPLGRSTLATFGKRAIAFRDVAVQQMSGETPLGTGAAQVAAVVGDPTALPRIVEMINVKVGNLPPNAVIQLDARDRLLELAWAIYFAGDAGRTASASIHKVMERKVESRAPPFGIVELNPKRFCRVLELIEGPAATVAYPYCSDPSVPFEQ
ncbi:hypothetical protein [Sphaerotilus mobilis]|uniref:Uncharacterized protein n=1 Tax=Sphaerotilus mobilis TaxID=47994 RepID=A0A4Q7LVA6_9BURK|nr:hypothetical protein [Sphaerotilus mobilis]RZS58403.1 hypothetical protein EV685_0696 [Sphaerotilus mobilis]